MSNYAKIKYYNIANGEGIRTAVFFTGCDFECSGCFNKELWDPNTGSEFTDDVKQDVFRSITEHTAGISILGGEPLSVYNYETVYRLCADFKSKFPDKSIWLWTGYEFEDVMDLDVMEYVDVLVDGRFVSNMREANLKWKGSSNQRVIDVNASFKTGSVTLYKNN